jgi:hypothetical protein
MTRETMEYWMVKAIERPLHLSPPQAEEAAAALVWCLQLATERLDQIDLEFKQGVMLTWKAD